MFINLRVAEEPEQVPESCGPSKNFICVNILDPPHSTELLKVE